MPECYCLLNSNKRCCFDIRSCRRLLIISSLRVSSFAFYSCSLFIYANVFCPVSGFCFLCNITHTLTPYMKFLFVGSKICRQLLSPTGVLWTDSSSKRTPLLLANDKYCNSRSGLAPYSVMNMPDTHKKPSHFREGLSANFLPDQS